MKTKKEILKVIEAVEKQEEIARYNKEVFLDTLKWIVGDQDD